MYNFLISLVGLVAMGAIVLGGARYLTSVGNPSAIEDAKHTIYSAIYGLILALASWVIISTINPDILVLKNPDMPWKAAGYSATGKEPQCALPGGPAGPESNTPCECKDGTNVLSKNPLPPSVVATVPAPCAGSIPTAAPAGAIVITYSEKMDKASVENPLAVSITPDPAFNNANTVRSLDVTGTILTIKPDPALSLTINNTVVVKVIGGNPAYNKNAAGTSMASNYEFQFQTTGAMGACTSPPVFSGFCNKVCGDPNLAKDGGYHCMKADLRVGTSSHPLGKEVTYHLSQKERIYMDARSYSYDGGYSGLNLSGDPYHSPFDTKVFDNGIDRYEINYWNHNGLVPLRDYAASEPNASGGFACSYIDGVLGLIQNGWWGVSGIDDWSDSDGARLTNPFPYTSVGKYVATLWVQGKSGGSACNQTMDTVIVNVVP